MGNNAVLDTSFMSSLREKKNFINIRLFLNTQHKDVRVIRGTLKSFLRENLFLTFLASA